MRQGPMGTQLRMLNITRKILQVEDGGGGRGGVKLRLQNSQLHLHVFGFSSYAG